MAFTTVKAIYDSFYTLIGGLDPDGKAAGGGYEFEPRSEAVSWDKVPESDMDRRFTVENLTRGEIQMFGTINEIDYGGTIQIHIMHAVTDDEREGTTRRDQDLYQICEEMEDKDNFDTMGGISLVRYANTLLQKRGNYWYTILTFKINYTLAAP